MITLTDNAVTAIQEFIQSTEKTIAGLRIRVEGGGCSGYRYGMKLEESVTANDEVIDFTGIKVLIDQESVSKLEGITIDYVNSLEGSGFKFENPNATESCGCGKSFAC